MFGHDPAHTSYNPDETQLKPPLRLKWSYATGWWVRSSPAVADGVVYVGSRDSKVYALNATTGSLVWSYQTGDAVYSSPAVADGVVYVGSYDNKVYALDASTGALRWSYATEGTVYSSPAVVGGVVYVGSWDTKVYALEAATASLRWSYTTGDRVMGVKIRWLNRTFSYPRRTETLGRARYETMLILTPMPPDPLSFQERGNEGSPGDTPETPAEGVPPLRSPKLGRG